METPHSSSGRGLAVLGAMAALVIVVAGLKAAAPMLVPIVAALFLALLCVPPMRKLERRGVPQWLALTIVGVTAALVLVGITAIFGRSLAGFQRELPSYEARLAALFDQLTTWLGTFGLDLGTDDLVRSIEPARIMRFMTDTAAGVLGVFSNVVLAILLMVFMLLEASSFPRKLRRALGNPGLELTSFRDIGTSVNHYMAIKTSLSVIAALLSGGVCLAAGVDFPLLWVLTAFLFNFIPNIGSVIAAVPPVLLAILEFGVGRGVIVAAGYLAVNFLVDNWIEKRWMGRRLGLSSLVVFLSLIFWGWVWGPVGMLFSVPLTVVVRLALENTTTFRWVAVMLGPEDDPAPSPAPVSAAPELK